MSDITFIAPTGAAILGLCQSDRIAWPVHWKDAANAGDILYVDDAGPVEWTDELVCGLPVFRDVMGQLWFAHHLITDDCIAAAYQGHAIAARNEMLHMRRAELFLQMSALGGDEREVVRYTRMALSSFNAARNIRYAWSWTLPRPQGDPLPSGFSDDRIPVLPPGNPITFVSPTDAQTQAVVDDMIERGVSVGVFRHTGAHSVIADKVEAMPPECAALYGPFDDGEETIEDIVTSAEAGFAGATKFDSAFDGSVSQLRTDLMQVGGRLTLLRQQIANAKSMHPEIANGVGMMLTESTVEVLDELIAALQADAVRGGARG